MTTERPFASLSISELERRADETSDLGQLRLMHIEVTQFRKTRAARNFAGKLGARLGGAPDTISSAEQSPLPIHLPAGEAPRRSLGPPRQRAGGGEPPRFAPTPEQKRAVDAFMTGGSLKISAFAGAGKTSTLKLMANARAGRGLYLAFNSAIAEEASHDFPNDVDCRTTHSMAARSVRGRHGFGRDKMFKAIGSMQLADVLELKPRIIDGKVKLTPPQQAFLFLATLQRFCQNATDQIELEHVCTTPRLMALSEKAQLDVKHWVLEEAQSLWARMLSPSDAMPLGHNGYLKLWGLERPILDFDYVLLDEAQDTNPVVLDVLTRQQTQMVYVGDKHQQIYEWRGAVNAMAEIKTDHETALTRSFRFGEAIARDANRVLHALGESLAIEGNPDRVSSVIASGQADAILARTNATVIKETLAAIEAGRKPYIVGGTTELKKMVGDVFSLMEDEPGSHPDFFGFKNWEEVIAFAESDEGESLRTFVMLVQQNGPKRLWSAIVNSAFDEKSADLCVSTAHKAKGREWISVQLANDFSANLAEEGATPEAEARLFYVAMTRAKERLIVDPTLLAAFTGARPFARATDMGLRLRQKLKTPAPDRSDEAPHSPASPHIGGDAPSSDWPAGLF